MMILMAVMQVAAVKPIVALLSLHKCLMLGRLIEVIVVICSIAGWLMWNHKLIAHASLLLIFIVISCS